MQHRNSQPLMMPSTSHTEEELLTALRKGAFLLKHGRSGKPKVHFFRLSASGTELAWRRMSGGTAGVPLAAVHGISPGQATPTFKRHPVRLGASCFSLLYKEPGTGEERSLDLTFEDSVVHSVWLAGLQVAVQRAKSGTQPRAVRPPGDLAMWGCTQRGAPPPAPLPPIPTNPLTSMPQSSTDCWPRGLTPQLVAGNAILDASVIALGRRHAAIISASGALYVLGEGKGGKLGLGHGIDAPAPTRVTHGLPEGVPIVSVACGDDCTAAVAETGEVFMWGRLPGEPAPVSLPSLVRGALVDVVVASVSCGPFHCAAVSREGRLFTWGEGFGGKLGHGDQGNRPLPTLVQSLCHAAVLQVACGVWHTAAIVAEPVGDLVPESERPHVVASPSIRGHHRRGSSVAGMGALDPATAYQEGKGGVLYTWGGVNESVAFGDGEQRRDSNKGCLGHGEGDLYTGQLLPTP